MKTPLIALITLLLAATAPAQDSIQNQLDEIAQRQRDAEGAYETDQIMQRAEYERQLERQRCLQECYELRQQCPWCICPTCD